MNLFVIPSWYPTKIHPEDGTFFRERAHILSRDGINVTVVSPVQHSLWDLIHIRKMTETQSRDQNINLLQKEIINKFPKCEKHSFKSYQSLAVGLFKRGVGLFGRPDAVYIHSSLWAGAALCSHLHKEAIPFAVSEHLMSFMQDGRFSAFQKMKIEETYRCAQTIVATSSSLQDQIMNKFPDARSKVRIIPNPADIQSFSQKETDGSHSPFRFIYIGLFRPEKRLDLLLDAFLKVKKSMPDTHLTIIGDGPLQKSVKHQIQRLHLKSSVTLTGYLTKDKIASQLRGHDALVLSSDVETFGVAPIEAMAVGLPVIATDCGGPSDYITPNTGLLIPKDDVQLLADGMIQLIENYDQFSRGKIRSFTIGRYGDDAYSNLVRAMIDDLN